jgi:hypothetical protein
MKGGFKLLNTRNFNNQLDITQIEKLINEKIPILYSLFLNTFEVHENCINEDFYQSNNNQLYCSTFRYKQYNFSSKYPDNYIIFDGFINVENATNAYLENIKYQHDIRINHMLCVGTAGGNNGIFVGLNAEKLDKIYFVSESDFYQIADNIFEFVRCIEFLSNEEDSEIMEDVPYSKLYRNWNEDFWRVREEA